jgi:hypothetical protein
LKKRTSINSIPRTHKEKEMADFRKCFYALALVALIAGLTVPASAQIVPFTCSAQAGVTPTVRVEGYTELVGDLVLGCQGGTPTLAGSQVPGVDITIVLNTNITSKLTNGTFDEALLIIDDPNAPGPNSNRPILNCGALGAPDVSNSSGPGVCEIFSTGNPANTYDGQAGVVGTAAGGSVVCGAAGSPGFVSSTNSFGCGRPNVFQGREGTVFNTGQFNAVTFNGVPVDPPGTGTTRTLRFTNVRADAEFLQVSSTFTPQTITMSVSTNGQTSIGINVSQQVVAIIAHGLVILNDGHGDISVPRLDFAQCNGENPTLSATRTGSILSATSGSFGGNTQFLPPTVEGFAYMRLQEGFANAWKPKNIEYTLANGVQNLAGQGYTYGFTTNVPTQDAIQNVPGAIYNTESGFEFGPSEFIPNPNPPAGVGTTPVTGSTGAGAQIFNNAYNGTSNTNISIAGSATQGTRLAVQFSNVPQGAAVFVQPTLWLFRQGAVGAAGIPAASLAPVTVSSGVMVLTATDAQGDTAISPPTGTLGSSNLVQVSGNLAVWEILFADASASEEVDIPIAVSFVSNLSSNLPAGLPAPNQIAQVTAGFAPFYGGSFSPNPRNPTSTSALPVPRFVPGNAPLNAFEIDKCECDLLFPFVTNQAGFDTGIAIANTSQDPGIAFGFNSTGQQQGSVTFFYYGVGNNGAAAPAPQTSGIVPAGQVLTYDVFSGGGQIGASTNGLNASAAGFQGYIIAQSSFQYCHGYAFISALGIGATGQGISEGYLGIVLDKNPVLPRTIFAAENDAH